MALIAGFLKQFCHSGYLEGAWYKSTWRFEIWSQCFSVGLPGSESYTKLWVFEILIVLNSIFILQKYL